MIVEGGAKPVFTNVERGRYDDEATFSCETENALQGREIQAKFPDSMHFVCGVRSFDEEVLNNQQFKNKVLPNFFRQYGRPAGPGFGQELFQFANDFAKKLGKRGGFCIWTACKEGGAYPKLKSKTWPYVSFIKIPPTDVVMLQDRLRIPLRVALVGNVGQKSKMRKAKQINAKCSKRTGMASESLLLYEQNTAAEAAINNSRSHGCSGAHDGTQDTLMDAATPADTVSVSDSTGSQFVALVLSFWLHSGMRFLTWTLRHNFFISHSGHDKAAAFCIERLLNLYGQGFFLDALHCNDRNNEESIYPAIKRCTRFLAITSENYRQSHWCAKELGHAEGLKKTVICLRIQRPPGEDCGMYFKQHNGTSTRGSIPDEIFEFFDRFLGIELTERDMRNLRMWMERLDQVDNLRTWEYRQAKDFVSGKLWCDEE